MSRSKFFQSVFLLLFCGLVAAIYMPGLQGSFFFDDVPNIVENAALRIEHFSADNIRALLVGEGGGFVRRPLAIITFALNYFFSGLAPWGYKATNLCIHLMCGWLVYLLVRRILVSNAIGQSPNNAGWIAVSVACVWLLHPLQLLPVLHVVQRMTSLSAFFLFAALLFHICGRERGGVRGGIELMLAWGLFWPMAYFSKENGVLFPLFATSWELTAGRLQWRGIDRFARGLLLVVGTAVLLAGVYLNTSFGSWLLAGYQMRDFTLSERLLTEGRVLWFYLGLFFLPRFEAFGLHHDYFVLSKGLFAPWWTALAWGGLVALTTSVALMGRRHLLIAFGVAWFLIGHLLESTVLPLELVHEHRNYVPLLGALLACVGVVQKLGGFEESKRFWTGTGWLVALLYLGLLTGLRAHQFGDELRRTQVEAMHHRVSARSQHEAGSVLASMPDASSPHSPAFGLAKTHFEIAADLDPRFKSSGVGLVYLHCRAGLPVEPAWITDLAVRLKEGPFSFGDQTVLFRLREIAIRYSNCLKRSDVDALFAAAMANRSLTPRVRAILYSWQGDYLWLAQEDLVAAQVAIERSLGLYPGSASNRLKQAQLSLLAGQVEKAKQQLAGLKTSVLSESERNTRDELLVRLSSVIAR